MGASFLSTHRGNAIKMFRALSTPWNCKIKDSTTVNEIGIPMAVVFPMVKGFGVPQITATKWCPRSLAKLVCL